MAIRFYVTPGVPGDTGRSLEETATWSDNSSGSLVFVVVDHPDGPMDIAVQAVVRTYSVDSSGIPGEGSSGRDVGWKVLRLNGVDSLPTINGGTAVFVFMPRALGALEDSVRAGEYVSSLQFRVTAANGRRVTKSFDILPSI